MRPTIIDDMHQSSKVKAAPAALRERANQRADTPRRTEDNGAKGLKGWLSGILPSKQAMHANRKASGT